MQYLIQIIGNPSKILPESIFFDKEWTEFFGVFDGDSLVGAAALFYNEYEYEESANHIGLQSGKIAEIGRVMVHPKYQQHNIASNILLQLIKVAKEKDIEYLIATVHPDNVPSQTLFQKFHFDKKPTYVKSNGCLRDVYLLKL